VAATAATAIGQRAQAGARKLYQIITDSRVDHTSSIDGSRMQMLRSQHSVARHVDGRMICSGLARRA